MGEAVQTLEGWYALHDFRSINWKSWKALAPQEREAVVEEMKQFLERCRRTEERKLGSTAFYSILGQKADFVFMHLRETLEELQELETAFQQTSLATHTSPAYSYVSVVELSSYMGKPGANPMEDPEIIARLKPELPKSRHICFYPMNKKRDGGDNWYMESMERRRDMMKSHGMIGRSYAGRVKQIITGSVGLDDWEWGVTLFGDDPLVFKKLVYEMRFDEASARYGEFGGFYVGNLLDGDKLKQLLGL